MTSTRRERSVIATCCAALALGAGLALPAQASAAGAGQQNRVVDLVNQARGKAGCAPVTAAPALTKAAEDHSADMAARGYFSHTTPEGVTFDQRIRNAGYDRPGAENIARGQTSAEQVVDGWMRSEGHRRNILNCELTAIGVGVDTGTWTWTQDFGR